MNNHINSWTVFFMYKPHTTIYTTLLIVDDLDLTEEEIINLAKIKIATETGIDLDKLREKLGDNKIFGQDWINVEDNMTATEEELEVLDVIRKIEY